MATSLTGDLEQARQHISRPGGRLAQLPAGVGLTPDQQAAQRRTRQQQVMAGRINETRQSIGATASQAARSIVGSNPLVAGVRFAQNTTFDDRLPGQAHRDAARAERQSRENAQWVRNNPEQAQAAQQFGQDVAGRAYRAGTSPLAQLPAGSPAQQQAAGGAAAPAAIAPLATSQAAAPTPAPTPEGQNLAPELTRNALAQTPVTSVSNRIVRDGNSFSANTPIREGATIGSTDTLAGGQRDDGQRIAQINTFSGQDAMRSNNLASQIRQQTRLENSNPNYLTVVRDSGVGGVRGELNRRENARTQERQSERRDQHQQRIAQGQQQLNQVMQQRRSDDVTADERLYTRQQDQIAEQRNQLGDSLTRQQIDQGEMNVAQQRQLRDLSARISDPNLTSEERAEAERAYQALTVSGRDRYMLQDVVMGYREDGSPIVGKTALDTLTGQAVAQGQQGPQISREGMTLAGYRDGQAIYQDENGNLFIDE